MWAICRRPCHRLRNLSYAPGALSSMRSVVISASRLDEFMQAELRVFAAKRHAQKRRFLDLVGASSSPRQLAQLVHEELPVRFARRIRHIERVEGWDKIPELVDLHAMHIQSFRELRLASPGDTEYPDSIFRIRQRHKSIAPLFAEAVKRIDQALIHEPSPGHVSEQEETGTELDRHAVELWAEAFLRSRVSTEMLMSHYETCIKASSQDSELQGDPTKVGIIDMRCDPWQICQQAIAQIEEGPWACLVEAENKSGKIEFCHVPRYLFYIMDELLQNSARATGETANEESELAAAPIKVSMCADDSQVVIRISDRGGGMPSHRAKEMWSYTFSTLPEAQESAARRPEADRPWGVFGGQSPISGRGIGLPLCRLYAMYLDGSLHIMNMPGLGVDAYLFLNRIDPYTSEA